jgi:hypothetical protein
VCKQCGKPEQFRALIAKYIPRNRIVSPMILDSDKENLSSEIDVVGKTDETRQTSAADEYGFA